MDRVKVKFDFFKEQEKIKNHPLQNKFIQGILGESKKTRCLMEPGMKTRSSISKIGYAFRLKGDNLDF